MKENLESILKIADKAERQKALMEYAKTMHVNVRKAKNMKNELSEDELIVLIYDAQKSQKTALFKNVALVIGAIIISLAIMLLVSLVKKVLGK